LLAAEKSVEFFKTTKGYRIVVNKENSTSTSSFRAIANAATLQDVTQNESFNQNEQKNKNKSKKHNHNHSSINRKKNEKCICKEEHFFKKCLYIVKFNRKRE
jgi:ABC-type nickel/cobalt efflux system permease component RcnA